MTRALAERIAPPHPVLGCLCAEGREVVGRECRAFLPAVHSCTYIVLRNSQLVEAARLTALEVSPDGPRWTAIFMQHVGRLTAHALRADERLSGRAALDEGPA
jgi:hypothetical protein